MKILILVLSVEQGIYINMQNAIRNTWGSSVPNNMTLKFNYGQKYKGQDKIIDEGDSIYINCEDTFTNILFKTLECFKFVLNNYEFDYIFRCCNGSYLNLDKLNEWVDSNSKTNVYNGVNGTCDGISFCSGSGFLISRDLVEKITNVENVNYNQPDDVEIGRLVSLVGKKLDDTATRYDIDNGNFHFTDFNHYHYHFRNYPEFMYNIHKLINKDRIKK